jgi:SEC-C motif-containing protein
MNRHGAAKRDCRDFLMRSESEVFDELRSLCGSPGYVHALALLCFRDNFIRFGRELKAKHLENLFSRERLIRTEITTLIGLLMTGPVDFAHPGMDELLVCVKRTEELLAELHGVLGEAMKDGCYREIDDDPERLGRVLREPFFYGGESAYGFQYRDLSEKRYSADDPWLLSQMGFSASDARRTIRAVMDVQERTLAVARRALDSMPRQSWTILPGFILTPAQVAERADLPVDIVGRVLDAFTLPVCDTNAEFTSLHATNAAIGTPLLRNGEGNYILLHQYDLLGALYESPFFWMKEDEAYRPTLSANRGRYTEALAHERLIKVFGTGHVYTNVDVWKNKREKLGEIDVLVVFGNRAIVLQAKSKMLTLEAQKGNDRKIQDDFKKAVQDSYDQAHQCSVALTGPDCILSDADGKPIKLQSPPSVVYPMCIVANHYPALSFQAHHFLKIQTADRLAPTLVTDVFALDTITEMLESPLRLLSYLELRARFGDRFMAMHETTLLAFHLRRNLWLNDDLDGVMLEDDVGIDLEIAMLARREGLPGARTPDGILTRIRGTAVGDIIAEIEARPDPGTIDFGLLLLELGEETVSTLSKGIRQIAAETRRDGKVHDVSIGLGSSSSGITIHCRDPSDRICAEERLGAHCAARKYSQKARRWFGLALRPDGSIWFGLSLDFPWTRDAQMEAAVEGLPKTSARPAFAIGSRGTRKVGRNQPCPCGSGKKYKKCCAD